VTASERIQEDNQMSFQQPEWVEARDYQQRAVQSWAEVGGQGVLEMATGTGKTVTSLLTAAHVAEQMDGKMAMVIAVPYQHLVDQWAEDVRDFGGNPTLHMKAERIGKNDLRENWQSSILAFAIARCHYNPHDVCL